MDTMPTPVGEIAPPPQFVNVTLPELKTHDGQPVVIRCARISAIEVARIVVEASQKSGVHQRLAVVGAVLIASAVEPRVSENGDPGTLPLSWLSVEDMLAADVALNELRVGGAGGPATEFPDGDAGGEGVVPPVGRDGGEVRENAG